MNKILIALVLAVVMSGNAYANFITDAFKTPKEMCLVAVEKGRLVEDKPSLKYPNKYGSQKYAYKGKMYTYLLNSYPIICNVDK